MFDLFKNHTGKEQQSIFLSHNSKDKVYGDVLRDLMRSIGICNKDIVYTSHEKNPVPLGENIYDYLRKKIEKSQIALFLLSSNYFNSVVCLNEMGASWVIQNTSYLFFVPGFDMKSQDFLDSCINQNSLGIILNGDKKCRQQLIEFAEKIANEMNYKLNMDDLYDIVENSCQKLREISPVNSEFTAKIVDMKINKNFIFCKLNILIPVGENYREGESHWLQLNLEYISNAIELKVEDKIKFKVTGFSNYEENKYGSKNFRNIYVNDVEKI